MKAIHAISVRFLVMSQTMREKSGEVDKGDRMIFFFFHFLCNVNSVCIHDLCTVVQYYICFH